MFMLKVYTVLTQWAWPCSVLHKTPWETDKMTALHITHEGLWLGLPLHEGYSWEQWEQDTQRTEASSVT